MAPTLVTAARLPFGAGLLSLALRLLLGSEGLGWAWLVLRLLLAIGSVTNLAARLCSAAESWQVLVAQRVFSATEGIAVGESVGELDLRGFSRPVRAFAVTGIDERKVRVKT